ncbi:MAG: hypothetical protein HYU97_08200 [Deltaproteobacteria bacterium]|nr:hypothetical protein [Deltaproteobacteria bacterium]
MFGIHEAQQKVVDFLATELGKEREMIRFIKMAKFEANWEAKVEVTELNEYLKKLGHPTIFDRNVYTVVLDPTLEIVSFAQTASRERSYATEEREEI